MADGANLISTETAAQLLMISGERVRQLVKAGWIDKPQKGRVSLTGAVQGYIRFLKDEERRNSKSASASRVSDRRADEIELRIEERSGALIEEARREALAIIDVFAGGLRADLTALPARLTNDIALRRRIENGIDDAFAAASKRAADTARGVDAAGAPERAEAAPPS